MTQAHTVLTTSGDEVLIRPIEPDDKQGLREGIERLGLTSRYRRFFTTAVEPSEAQLRYLTEVDHHSHEALLAIDPLTNDGVGVARFVRSGEDPRVAEVAVAVTDAWQRRGVGTRLLQDLATRAREEGIQHFSASVLAENETMLDLLARLGDARVTGRGHGVIDLLMDVPEQGLPATLTHAVRAAARGDLSAPGPTLD